MVPHLYILKLFRLLSFWALSTCISESSHVWMARKQFTLCNWCILILLRELLVSTDDTNSTHCDDGKSLFWMCGHFLHFYDPEFKLCLIVTLCVLATWQTAKWYGPMFCACPDVDECLESPSLCFGGRCKNTEGSFLCVCPQGFLVDEEGTSCVGKYSRLVLPKYIFMFLWKTVLHTHTQTGKTCVRVYVSRTDDRNPSCS